jgi:PIN domain nuclease of toxin-antitoxin system
MRGLLDAQALILAHDNPGMLGSSASAFIRNPLNERIVGTGSLWEIGIKVTIGKLKLSLPYKQWVEEAFLALNLIELPIRLDDIDRQRTLPFHHRDPFDRLLAAQSLVEGIPVIGSDDKFDLYGVTRIWD